MQAISTVIDQEVATILAPEERQLCEVWTRVMGYFRPVSSFNHGKKGEFHERKCFLEAECD